MPTILMPWPSAQKIAQEEEEFVTANLANSALMIKMAAPRAIAEIVKECPADEVSEYTRLLNEFTTMAHEYMTQHNRHHALGY